MSPVCPTNPSVEHHKPDSCKPHRELIPQECDLARARRLGSPAGSAGSRNSRKHVAELDVSRVRDPSGTLLTFISVPANMCTPSMSVLKHCLSDAGVRVKPVVNNSRCLASAVRRY